MKTYEEILAKDHIKNYLLESAYDFNDWNIGKGLTYDAANECLKPIFTSIRPMEESTPFLVGFPYDVSKSPTESYIFFADNAPASATRRVRLYTVNAKTGAIVSNGFITLTLPTATNHTTRDLRIDYKTVTNGLVSASGTDVTGSSTNFSASGVAVGARIGFGSTDPTQITQWHRIQSVNSDTSLTLVSNAGTIPANTPYIIEEFRPVLLTTNATTTNGGVFLAKGVTPEDFTPSGTTIPTATTVDNQKACYWLKDATTQTNIVGCGIAQDDAVSQTSRDLYVLDSPVAATYKVYKYNIRASLTSLTSGASTAAFQLATGNQGVTGTISQVGNLALATTNHGAGAGVKSLYFVTTTRFYRAALSLITNGSVTWQSDNISEIPSGGTNTYAATSALVACGYSPNTDRFVIFTTVYNYYTQYVTSGQQFEKIFSRNLLNLDQSLADSDQPLFYSNAALAQSGTSLEGKNLFVICKHGSGTNTMQAYLMCMASDWDYANSNQGYLISPKISVTAAEKFLRGFILENRYLGLNEHTKPTEPFSVYFRTTNIETDATSGWTLLSKDYDLSAFSGADDCQFKLLFKTVGETCLPAQIKGIGVGYVNRTTDAKWVFSREKSVPASKQFAFRQKTQYGTSYPTLTIQLIDSVSGAVLLTDDSISQADGTWEKSTDGTSWGAYNSTDRASGSAGDNTYVRFTPTAALTGKIEARLF